MSDALRHAEAILDRAGLEVAEVRELTTGLGWQLRCPGGEIVAVYRTGKMVAQGKNQAAMKALLSAVPPMPKPSVIRRAPAPPAPSGMEPGPHALSTGGTASRFPENWTTEPWDGASIPF